MIHTRLGMFVREVVSINPAADIAEVKGFGRPEQRELLHTVKLSDLIADGGMDEIRRRMITPSGGRQSPGSSIAEPGDSRPPLGKNR